MLDDADLSFRDFIHSQLAALQDRLVARAQHLERENHDLQLRLNLAQERLSPRERIELDVAFQSSSTHQNDHGNHSRLSIMDNTSHHRKKDLHFLQQGSGFGSQHFESHPHLEQGHSFNRVLEPVRKSVMQPRASGLHAFHHPPGVQGIIAQHLAVQGFENYLSDHRQYVKTHEQQRNYVPRRSCRPQIADREADDHHNHQHASLSRAGTNADDHHNHQHASLSRGGTRQSDMTQGVTPQSSILPCQTPANGHRQSELPQSGPMATLKASTTRTSHDMPVAGWDSRASDGSLLDASPSEFDRSVEVGICGSAQVVAPFDGSWYESESSVVPACANKRKSNDSDAVASNAGLCEGVPLGLNIPDLPQIADAKEDRSKSAQQAPAAPSGEPPTMQVQLAPANGSALSPLALGGPQQTLVLPSQPGASNQQLYLTHTLTFNADESENVFEVLPEWRFRPAASKKNLSRGVGTFQFKKNATKLFDADEEEQGEDPTVAHTYRNVTGAAHHHLHDDHEHHDRHHENSLVLEPCMLMPNSMFRFCWDLTGMFFIVYDAVWLPLMFFHPPENVFTDLVVWLTRIFWSLDLPINFRTGFITQVGELEMRSKKVASRYVLSWFLVDLVVIGSDWLEFVVDNGGGGVNAARFAKTFKIARTLRMLRLMRLMKLPGIIHHFADEFSNKVRSEKMFLVGGVLKIMGGVVCFVHIVGCFWFLVGESDSVNSWIIFYDVYNKSMAYQYMTCFHWSLSQLSGNMEVTPQNLSERVFAVAALLVAWMISASAVSVITTAMTRDSFFNIQGSMESVKLRKYLLEHRISRKLMSRILRNASYATAERTRNVTEDNLELLKLVSEPLRVELHFEVGSPILSAHPFFRNYKEFHPAAMRRVCHSSVTQVCLSPGDVLFSEGETPTVPVMYFVVSGTLKYWQGCYKPIWMRPGHYGAEANLWTHWLHQGYLRASTECNIVALGTKGFCDCDAHFASAFGDRKGHAAKYAESFVAELNKSVDSGGLLTDLESEDYLIDELCSKVFDELSAEDNVLQNGKESTKRATSVMGHSLSQKIIKKMSRGQSGVDLVLAGSAAKRVSTFMTGIASRVTNFKRGTVVGAKLKAKETGVLPGAEEPGDRKGKVSTLTENGYGSRMEKVNEEDSSGDDGVEDLQ